MPYIPFREGYGGVEFRGRGVYLRQMSNGTRGGDTTSVLFIYV